MNRFDARLERLSLSTVSLLSQIDNLNGQWLGGARLNPQALGRLKRSVLATSTGASTRIEGAKLSDEEVEALMRDLSAQKLVDRDTQEVQGYYETLATVFESWKEIDITESNIKHLHAQLLKYSQKDVRQRGEYKKLDNRVVATDSDGQEVGVLFETTVPYLTPKEMSELVVWAQNAFEERRYHPLLITANFVVEFLKIHPFLDGNGRLSRILTNLLMLRSGYEYAPYASHEKLVEDNKTDYYLALRRSQVTFNTPNESVSKWVLFFLETSLAQAKQAIGLLSVETTDKLLSPNQLLVWQYMQKVDEASIQDIVEATNVKRPTVRQAMNRLLVLKRVERIGQGRGARYRKV
jgi:Fic family protein